MQRAEFRLVEECSGTGELVRGADSLGRVRYAIARYQGMLEGTGMPVPGVHRVEGTIEGAAMAELVGRNLTLRLEDGRALAITVADATGRVLTQGHGPYGCSCC